jgi:hypothetical protein
MNTDIRPTEQEKYADEHNEHADSLAEAKHDEIAIALLPESLRGLSEDERALLEKQMVRKMDMVVL